MINRIVITSLVLIGALGLAGSAFADTTAAAPAKKPDQCVTLEHKFDSAKKDHVSATKLKNAREQRAHGGELCSQGKTAEGIKALDLAIKDIGQI